MWMDIRYRRIPNQAVMLLILIGLFYMISIQNEGRLVKGGIVIPLVVLGICGALSFRKIIGMGDTKFLFVTLLLSPQAWQVEIVYFVSFIGGIWSLIWYFILRKVPPFVRLDTIREGIPYGIPIALALCIFTFIG